MKSKRALNGQKFILFFRHFSSFFIPLKYIFECILRYIYNVAAGLLAIPPEQT